MRPGRALIAAACAVLLSGIAQAAIDWVPCADPPLPPEFDCARVAVPLDWTGHDPGDVALAVIRHHASRAEERIGSLFVNPGGPGVSGVDFVRGNSAELDALGRGRFDVIGWDARGTGESSGVRCFAYEAARSAFWGDTPIPATTLASRQYVSRTVGLASRCGELNGGLLAHISTLDTVRDLDTLRELVGEATLTFLGFSYGTFLGQTYASVFPDRVRAMVLDGVVDPVAFTRSAEARVTNTIRDTDLVFRKFQSLCQRAGPGRCALAGQGSVAGRMRRLFARARRGPIPAPSAKPPRPLTYGELLTAIFARPLGVPAGWQRLADGLAEAGAGDASRLAGWARSFPRREIEPAMAIACADSPARRGVRAWPAVISRLDGVSRIYGRLLGWWLWAPCAAWPAPSTERYAGPWDAATPHPILVIGTRFDPDTPFANARRAARRLGNAILLTHLGYGHTSSNDPSTCVDRAVSAYLVDLSTPRRGTVCQADRLPFDRDFGKPVEASTGTGTGTGNGSISRVANRFRIPG